MATSPAHAIDADEQETTVDVNALNASSETTVRDLIESLPDRLVESHPVDIRLSIPLGFNRYFLTITVGSERRRTERRLRDRLYYPLFTLGNNLFMGMTTIVCVVTAILGLLAFSSIVSF